MSRRRLSAEPAQLTFADATPVAPETVAAGETVVDLLQPACPFCRSPLADHARNVPEPGEHIDGPLLVGPYPDPHPVYRWAVRPLHPCGLRWHLCDFFATEGEALLRASFLRERYATALRLPCGCDCTAPGERCDEAKRLLAACKVTNVERSADAAGPEAEAAFDAALDAYHRHLQIQKYATPREAGEGRRE